MKRVAIIGAGIAGIASAVRLSAKGYNVDVFEANRYAGGKLTDFKLGGFRFDAGPSLFTLPSLIDELFVYSKKKPKSYFQYLQKDVICQYFYADGTHLTAWSDVDRFAEEVEQKLKIPKQRVTKYLNRSEQKYNLTKGLFLEKSLHKYSTYFSKDTIKGIVNLFKLDIFKTLNQTNEDFFQNDKLVQLFNRYATYNGSNPYETPGIMSMIPHLEFGIGTYFPTKGMSSITNSLVKLAKENGAKFHFGKKVTAINHTNSKVEGIQLEGKNQSYDLVISNMDIVPTYRHLLKKVKHPEKVLNQPRSSSALIFYWGIKGTFSQLDLHNILFSKNYKKEFDELFQKKTIHDDPTVYINITSKEKSDDAPLGCENWFVMINTPPNEGQDWDTLIKSAREKVIEKINRTLKVDIEKLIIKEEILDPREIELKTSSYQGALYGASSNNRNAAFLRHANFSSLKGLYFVGGSVHPGGGIPLCLLSAKITTNLILNSN